MTLATSFRFLHRVARHWLTSKVNQSAAAMAYYALFALAPTLVFATVVAQRFVSRQDAKQLVEQQLTDAIGPAGADVAALILNNSHLWRHGTAPTVVSILLVLYGASSVFAQLKLTLERIFGHEVHSAAEGVLHAVVGRLLAALFAILAGTVLVATVLGTVLLHSTEAKLLPWSGRDGWLWHATSTAFSLVVIALVLTAIFTLLPSKHPPLRQLWVGILVSAALFELGKWVFGFYISRSFIASAYGPSSSIVALIVWIYYSAQIILLGAVVGRCLEVEPAESQPPGDALEGGGTNST